MAILNNPFAGRDGYNCFGCSPDNQLGLRMKFDWDGEKVTANWEPRHDFEGWTNVLHGGIQATLMDEAGSWLVFAQLKTGGVTTKLEVKYRRPVPINQGRIRIVAKLLDASSRLATIQLSLFAPNGEVCSEGIATYFLFDRNSERGKEMFPGDAVL